MIIIMNTKADNSDVEKLKNVLESKGLQTNISKGNEGDRKSVV